MRDFYMNILIVEQFGAVHAKLFPSLTTNSRSGPARMENTAIVTFDGLPKGIIFTRMVM